MQTHVTYKSLAKTSDPQLRKLKTYTRYTFVITSLIYACACVVYTPLLWLVPRKEKDWLSGR